MASIQPRRTKYEKHGLSGSPEYQTWEMIIDRCYNKDRAKYKNHGGRGIKVCKEWRNSFLAFYRDMGKKPMGLTIERKDNNGDYTKENCIWADITTQNINRKPSRPNKFGYIGVSVSHSKYKAEIAIEKQKFHIGIFDTPEEAANGYDSFALELHGKLARLNFDYY